MNLNRLLAQASYQFCLEGGMDERYKDYHETSISLDAHYSYLYARNILRGRRFHKGENNALSTDSAQYAYTYAKEIVRGRCEKLEPIIMTDPDIAYCYIKTIVRMPLIEFEPLFASTAVLAFNYAKYILRRRFPLGERIISTMPNFAREYSVLFRIEIKPIQIEIHDWINEGF